MARAPKRTVKRNSEAQLVRACVTYAQAIAAIRAGHEVDPSPDGSHAAALAAKHGERAARALETIAHLPARTPLAIDAKARLVPVIMAAAYGSLCEEEQAVILGLASDVRAYLAEVARISGDVDPSDWD